MRAKKEGLKLLYCGPYSEDYGINLLCNKAIVRWLIYTSSKIHFTGDTLDNAILRRTYKRRQSDYHEIHNYLSKKEYNDLLNDMDITLSLQDSQRLSTNYPSKFFEFIRNNTICISGVDMNLPVKINKLYPTLNEFNQEGLFIALESVRNNMENWKKKSYLLNNELKTCYCVEKQSQALDEFIKNSVQEKQYIQTTDS